MEKNTKQTPTKNSALIWTIVSLLYVFTGIYTAFFSSNKDLTQGIMDFILAALFYSIGVSSKNT